MVEVLRSVGRLLIGLARLCGTCGMSTLRTGWRWRRVRSCPVLSCPVDRPRAAPNQDVSAARVLRFDTHRPPIPASPQTLGDDHPVTEESLQALAAAGGSSTPVTPSPSSRPSSMSREVGLAVAAAAAGAGTAAAASTPRSGSAAGVQPSPATTTGSRPTSVDPPPPSLECLNSSDHARETAREQQVCAYLRVLKKGETEAYGGRVSFFLLLY